MKNTIKFILILLLISGSITAQIKRVSPDNLTKSAIFGKAVSTFGNWAAISAPGHDTETQYKCGVVFMYYYSEGEWHTHSSISPQDAADLKYFGYSVKLTGNRLFVGATGDNAKGPFSGAVYCYELVNNKWEFKQKIISEGKAAQYFGSSITSIGNTLVIGAYLGSGKTAKSGVVYVYKNLLNSWVLSQNLFDENGNDNQQFGYDIDMQYEGTIIIGSPKANGVKEQAGAVYVFDKSVSGYQFVSKLIDPNGEYGNQFGRSVSLYNNYLAIGSHLSNIQSGTPGTVFLYKKALNKWELNTKISNTYKNKDYFGYDVAISRNYLLVGAPNYNIEDVGNVGSAFLYKNDDGEWKVIDNIKLVGEKPIDYFGSSVFMDSLNLIVGAHLNGDTDKGAAYISKLSAITGETDPLPEYFSLEQNYPNPFNASTRIIYTIKESNITRLILYDILGRKVKTLVNELKEPGKYYYNLTSDRLASGVYFYRIEAGNFVDTKKLMLLK